MDEAFITLGPRNEGSGISLVGDKIPGPDGELDVRSEAAEAGGRPCRRFLHLEYRESQGGWARGNTRQTDVTTGAMAFRIAPEAAGGLRGEVELAVEYLDQGYHPWQVQLPSGEQRTGWVINSGQWREARFRVPAEGLGDGPMVVRSEFPMFLSRLALRAPTVPATSGAEIAREMRDAYQPGMQFCVGNMGGILPAHDALHMPMMRQWLPIFQGMGATSIQSYVRWSLIEPEPERFDWSFYDDVVETLQAAGLRWVAFIMFGQEYATPAWFRESDRSIYTRCLEHGEDSHVQSIWNPYLLEQVDRFLGLVAGRYHHGDLVESVMLGPSGDYGETTFNAVYAFGDYHKHLGYWCGDRYAAVDFRRHLEEKYGALDALNRVWQSRHERFEDISPFLREAAPSLQAWLDLMDWYVGSMTRFSARWAEIARRHFPGPDIHFAAGGSGDPIHGGNFAAQAKLAAPFQVGHRVTNEGSNYAFNFAYTRWEATACKHYRLSFGNEPWGGDASGVGNLGRMFNAITSNARQFWTYSNHLRTPECLEAIIRFRDQLEPEPALVDVAVLYPWTHFIVTDEHGFAEGRRRSMFWPQAEELRDITDYDVVDEVLLRDGALDSYRFLVVLQGQTMEADCLDIIARWVEAGGTLITHDFGPVVTPSGDASAWQRLWENVEPTVIGGAAAQVARRASDGGRSGAPRERPPMIGAAIRLAMCADVIGNEGDRKDHPATAPGLLDLVAAVLRDPEGQGLGGPRIEPDGVADGVFASVIPSGVIYLNTNAEAVKKRIHQPGGEPLEVTVPGFSVFRVAL